MGSIKACSCCAREPDTLEVRAVLVLPTSACCRRGNYRGCVSNERYEGSVIMYGIRSSKREGQRDDEKQGLMAC